MAAAQDPVVSAPDASAPASAWTWFGDLRVQGDRVTDIPRPVESDVQGAFGQGRFGVLFDPIPTLQFGAAIRLAYASIPNSEDRSYNNNQRSNDVAAEQLFMRWHPNDNTSVLLGKTMLPLELS